MQPSLPSRIAFPALALSLSSGLLWSLGAAEDAQLAFDLPAYDPLAYARERGAPPETNWEATVPPACYTKTDGISNPCWVCHTIGVAPNDLVDRDLQARYAFSAGALKNHWANLFEDRTEAAAAITDDEARAWFAGDNYAPLRAALARFKGEEFPGYRPDLDLEAGFDEDGFARDGSGWRAVRYKPFNGTFWPTNGSTDDVFVRLPQRFRTRAGEPSREVEKANLTLLEVALAADFRVTDPRALVHPIEPLDEAALGVDLDGDGAVQGRATVLRGLPATYFGDAADEALERFVNPAGVEYLHTVRYVDPASPTGHSRRMKELRWSRKDLGLDAWGRQRAYEQEYNAKEEGVIPYFQGEPTIGLSNDFGWRLQGFIEDEAGRLRLQSDEEHRFCMGCHSSLGVTVDHTFTLARKAPGLDGWRYQDLAGMQDAPQLGHAQPEVLTYLQRVRGGDEFRSNTEMLARFFTADGAVREAAVLRAAPGGDQDLRALLMPSERRALDLAKAYMTLVRKQRFELGRDAILAPVVNVHAAIENGDTALGASGLLFNDGRLWLDWAWRP
ncbi:MAG: hypothetical protein R3F49_10260 [Planctomycetota bacterium]